MNKYVFIIILLFYNISFADEYFWKPNGYLRQSSIYEDRTDIYDKDGEKEGWLKPDHLTDDRVYIYDKSGKEKGYLQKDPLNKDRVIIHELAAIVESRNLFSAAGIGHTRLGNAWKTL